MRRLGRYREERREQVHEQLALLKQRALRVIELQNRVRAISAERELIELMRSCRINIWYKPWTWFLGKSVSTEMASKKAEIMQQALEEYCKQFYDPDGCPYCDPSGILPCAGGTAYFCSHSKLGPFYS